MKVLAVALFVCLAVLSVQALSDEQKQNFQGLYKKCTADTGVNTDLILKARKKNFTEDPKLMAYYSCMFKNLGFQGADGKLNVDVMIAKLPLENKEGTDVTIRSCAAGVTGDNADIIAYKASECFIENINEEISF